MFNIRKIKLSNTLIGWIIVVTALTALSIYNVYCVLYEYIYNNKVTEVTVKPLENVYPMIPSMSIYYQYSEKAVFPETWAMSEEELDQLLPWRPANRTMPPDGWPASRRLAKRKDEASFGATSGKLPLDSLIDIATITNFVYYMDHYFIKCQHDIGKNLTTTGDNDTEAVADPDKCATYTGEFTPDRYPLAVNDSSLHPLILSVMAAFVRNDYGPKYADMAVSRVLNSEYWGKRYQRLHATGTIADVPATTPVVDALGPFGMQITIPFDFLSNVTSSDPQPYLGIIPANFNNVSQLPKLDKKQFWISGFPMRSSTETHYFIGTPIGYASQTAQVAKITKFQYFVYFQKIDVFDSTELYGDERCSVCGDLQTVSECVFKCKLDALIDDCGCVPFSYRRLYANDTNRQSKPYCTNDDYKACYLSAKYNPSRCSGDRYVPCVMSENTFEIDLDQDPREEVFHLINLRIFWDKSAYVIFEDKIQENWMQMLGQLGGNLGVFLSFSLLGLWNFVIFLLKYYREQRGKRAANQVHDASGVVSSWLRFAQINEEVSSSKLLIQGEIERRTESLRALIDEIDMKYGDDVDDQKLPLKSDFKYPSKLEEYQANGTE